VIFDPRDWYWFVGGGGPNLDDNGEHTGDESQAFSSKRNQYVPSDDPEFAAWRDAMKAGAGLPPESTADPTTRIDTEDNLADVLEPYGINPNFSRKATA